LFLSTKPLRVVCWPSLLQAAAAVVVVVEEEEEEEEEVVVVEVDAVSLLTILATLYP